MIYNFFLIARFPVTLKFVSVKIIIFRVCTKDITKPFDTGEYQVGGNDDAHGLEVTIGAIICYGSSLIPTSICTKAGLFCHMIMGIQLFSYWKMLKTANYTELQPFNFTFVTGYDETQNPYAGCTARLLSVYVYNQ